MAAHDIAHRHSRASQRTTRWSIRVLAPCARKDVISEPPGARAERQLAGLWCAASATDDQDSRQDQDGSGRDQHCGSPNIAGPIVRLYRAIGSAGRFFGRGADALHVLEFVERRRWWRCVDEFHDQASDLSVESVTHVS